MSRLYHHATRTIGPLLLILVSGCFESKVAIHQVLPAYRHSSPEALSSNVVSTLSQRGFQTSESTASPDQDGRPRQYIIAFDSSLYEGKVYVDSTTWPADGKCGITYEVQRKKGASQRGMTDLSEALKDTWAE